MSQIPHQVMRINHPPTKHGHGWHAACNRTRTDSRGGVGRQVEPWLYFVVTEMLTSFAREMDNEISGCCRDSNLTPKRTDISGSVG